ncbi:MAG: carboxylesterase/lipase family protein [Alphaproteobacteria bacterium]|nr:carboxylesterase/lipase family protein [Alphaproteobacteria bacterium]
MTDARNRHGLDRRRMLAASGLAAAGLALTGSRATAAEAPVAKTAYGKVRGTADGTVKIFKGVPYGASTAGANRFLPPKPPMPWRDVREAAALGSRAPQTDATGFMEEEVVALDRTQQSEDCLRLNIWTTGLADGRKRPVMLWCHGGGFTGGSGGNVRYDGTMLAKKHDVVLVTINHRLNAFGFLYLGKLGGEKYADSGNVGMLDIVAALNWVKENIAEFGGDPGNVTIFGQSGGGSKVTTAMAMPQAQGRFHRVIAESGVLLKAITPDEGSDIAARILKQLDIAPGAVDRLQQVPFQKIIAALGPMGPSGRFGPVLDGRNLISGNGPFDPVAPSLSANVPLILGSTLTEVTFLNTTPLDPIDDATLRADIKRTLKVDDATTEKLVALYKKDFPQADNVRLYQILASDNWLTANVALTAERKAMLGRAPAYVYHFEKPTPVRGGKLGVPHTLEVSYVFDNLDGATDDIITGKGQDRYPLADKMSRAWTQFARTGDPNVSGLPQWRPYSASDRAVMVFDDRCELQVDPRAEARKAILELHMAQGQVSRA